MTKYCHQPLIKRRSLCFSNKMFYISGHEWLMNKCLCKNLQNTSEVLQKVCDNKKTAQSLKCIIKTLMFSPYGSLLSLFFAGEDIKVFLTWHGADTNDQTLHQSIQGEGGAEDGHALGDVLPHLLLHEAQGRSTSQWHLNYHPSYESTGFISVTV